MSDTRHLACRFDLFGLPGLFSFEAAAIDMGPTKRWGGGRTATAFVTKPTGQVANQSPRRRILRLHVIFLGPDNLAARATDASAWLKIRRKGMRGRAPSCGVSTVIKSPFAARSRRKCPTRDIGLASTAKKEQRSWVIGLCLPSTRLSDKKQGKCLPKPRLSKSNARGFQKRNRSLVGAGIVKSIEHDREEQRGGG